MSNVAEIGRCQQCGKLLNSKRLHHVDDLFGRKRLCTKCYQAFQRSFWGYW